MGHARRQQADGAQLLRLLQLLLKLDAVGYIIENHQPADTIKVLRHQRRDGDIQYAVFGRLGRRFGQRLGPQPVFVDVVNAGLLADAHKLLDQIVGEQSAQRPPHGLVARNAVHQLELRVPALDPVFQVHGQDSDVNRLDDVFAEILQSLVLIHLLLERLVQPRVFDGNAQITDHRLEKLQILASQKLVVVRSSQPKEGHRFPARGAGEVISKIEICDRAPHWRRVVQSPARALEKQIGFRLHASLRPGGFQKTEVKKIPRLDVASFAVPKIQPLGQFPTRDGRAPGGSRSLPGQKDGYALNAQRL